jgi:large repetitive protein
VPYVITVTNEVGFDLSEVSIVDRFPPGFKYVEGSARIDKVPAEPVLVGRELVWSNLAITGAGRHRIELLLAVGAGVSEGDFVNRAQVVHGVTGNALSNEASATVRLVPDPDFDCTDVLGKVFDDANRNGFQDAGEAGIPAVRLVTATGLSVRTDSYGRFHITCATVPHDGRGSNFVLKLDDRTLPSGFRASSSPVRIERATRGKALRFSFGASIHRVIGLDISDPIFEPGLTDLRPQWQPRIDLLLDELQAAPAVLRLSYLADVEDPRLVEDRLDAIEGVIRARWEGMDCCYELEIEPEVFWRLGTPPRRPGVSRRDGR